MGDFRTFDIVSAQRVQLASLNLPSGAQPAWMRTCFAVR
jgi:hypothetical protein